MTTRKREVIDTITYQNGGNQTVTITLVKYGPQAFTVETKIGTRVSTRGFSSEKQANDYIVGLQR